MLSTISRVKAVVGGMLLGMGQASAWNTSSVDWRISFAMCFIGIGLLAQTDWRDFRPEPAVGSLPAEGEQE